MTLDSEQRRLFRKEMLRAFDAASLDIFLQDWMDISLANAIAVDGNFERQCQLVIRWAEESGRLVKFLQMIEAHHTRAEFRALATNLRSVAPAVVVAVDGAPRPFRVSERPVLDRTTFWQRLTTLAAGGGNRVLAVNGGVGKSYSRWPVSHVCGPTKNVARMVRVEVNEGNVVGVDGARLANLISMRLWGDADLADPAGLTQSHRVTRNSATQLIQRFSALTAQTWLILDELNLVNLDDSAIELLGKLAEAVDGGECPQLWLFLFGLNPDTLGPRVGRFVAVDQVKRPARQDIEDYLMWFSQWVGRPQSLPVLAAIVGDLDALLPPAPEHSHWEMFHDKLQDTCTGIAEGALP